MKHFCLLLLACIFSSCEFFQMERRTSDVILEEEIQALDWNEVDVYPVFSNCQDLQEAEQLDCFVTSLHDKVTHSMQRYAQMHYIDSLTQLDIEITIDKNKNLSFTTDADTIAFKSAENLQLLLTNIQEGLDSLQVTEPALKRGIPVTTKFALPIIFIQENE